MKKNNKILKLGYIIPMLSAFPMLAISCGESQQSSNTQAKELKAKDNLVIDYFDMVYSSEFLKEIFEKPENYSNYDNYEIKIALDEDGNLLLGKDFAIYLDFYFWNNNNEDNIKIERYIYKNLDTSNLEKYIDLSTKIEEITKNKNWKLSEEFKDIKFADILDFDQEKLKKAFPININEEEYSYDLFINYQASNYDYLSLNLSLNFKNNENFPGVNKTFIVKNVWNYSDNEKNTLLNKQKQMYEDVVGKILKLTEDEYNPNFDIFHVPASKVKTKNNQPLLVKDLNEDNIFDNLSFSAEASYLNKYDFVVLKVLPQNDINGIVLNLLVIDKSNKNAFLTLRLLIKNDSEFTVFQKQEEDNSKDNLRQKSNKMFLSKFLLFNENINNNLDFEGIEKEEIVKISNTAHPNQYETLFNIYNNSKKMSKYFLFFPMLNNIDIYRIFSLNQNLEKFDDKNSKFYFLNTKKINLYKDNYIFEFNDTLLQDEKMQKMHMVYFQNNSTKGKIILEDDEIEYILEKEQDNFLDLLEKINKNASVNGNKFDRIFSLDENLKEELRDFRTKMEVREKSFFEKLIKKNEILGDLEFEIEDVNFNFLLKNNYEPTTALEEIYSTLDAADQKNENIYIKINILSYDGNYSLSLYYKIKIPNSGLELIQLKSLLK